MMRKLLVALTMLSSVSSLADTVVKYGANLPKYKEDLGSTKALFIANQRRWFGYFIGQLEAGAWFDNTGIDRRRSSALLGASLGIHVNAGYVYGQILFGPAWISSPDSALGGNFQFNNDVAFGIQDPKTETSVGFAYKHVSSAGIELPNRGRDFLMFRVSIPF